jgi:hypothetical protein
VSTGSLKNSAQYGNWPLGIGPEKTMLYGAGPVNLYGRRDAAASWLVQLVATLLTEKPAGLVVIDGAGDLVPVLKRKPLVTQRLGRGITYVDVDGAVVAGGINPLAPVPGETEAQTTVRWQRWFAAMDVHPDSLPLLPLAREEGVGDITELERWLSRPDRQSALPRARSLTIAIRRLMSNDVVREWLAWPTDCFTAMSTGILLFSCCRGSWAREQLLHSLALAAAHLPDARVILHHTPWTWPLPGSLVKGKLLITNGPLLDEATVVLTRSDRHAAKTLARRFLAGSLLHQENLQLLQEHNAIVAVNGLATPVSWYPRRKM